MKARVLLYGLAAMVLVVSMAAADDPWKSASYENWNDKDVQKIFKSSPWGREVVTMTKTQSADNKQKASNSSVNRSDRPEELPSEWVQVVWWSSKTVRRAVLRMAMIKGAKFPSEQAKEFTETPMDDLVVVLWGDPKTLATLALMEPAELMKVAYLDLPRLKAKIEPIEAAPIVEGKSPVDRIRFHFPRKFNGADTVSAEDSRMVFKWRMVRNPKVKIEDAQMFEVVFNPNKMMSGGAADY